MRTIDLFCGAGGISEGFRQAGFQTLYGNDFMPEAIKTFQLNHPKAIADNRTIESVSPKELRERLDLEEGELEVLVGGPPCQGFSINSPGRFLDDPRNKLFKYYERFLEEFQPLTFMFENVPGLLSMADGQIFDTIIRIFNSLDYYISIKILYSAHYGVPQERWRLIILGSKFAPPSHPLPTHFHKGRANFRGGSSLVFKLDDELPNTLLPPVTVGEAIGDLPELAIGEGAEKVFYTKDPNSEYSRKLRNPLGYTFNHLAANLSAQNQKRISLLKPGESWRDLPRELLPKGMQSARKSDHTKRYGRLTKDGLSGTIMTKCDPHWGAVILPDQNRTLTVREAARLQSFPDYYEFIGSRVAQYIQVGNAVPVFMARAIADNLRNHIEHYKNKTLRIQYGKVSSFGY